MKRFLVFASTLSFLIFFCMDAHATDRCWHPKKCDPSASASAYTFGVQSQWVQNQNSFSGSVNASGSNNTSFNADATKPDFLHVDAYQAAPPMDYRGPYEKSAMADVMPWFDHDKWAKKDFEGYPAGGKVTCTGPEAPSDKQSEYFYMRDGRDKETQKKGYKITTCICESDGTSDNVITVWGKCGPALLKRGVKIAYVVASSITFMASWESANVGATGGLGGFFGNLFGFSAQAGGNKASGIAGPHEKLTLVVEGNYLTF